MTVVYSNRPSTTAFLKTVLLASTVTLSAVGVLVNLWRFLGIEVNGVGMGGGYLAAIFSAGVIAPLLETALMAAMISFFKQLSSNNALVITTTALLWAFMHGVFDIYWGINTFFGFVVFCAVYLKFIAFGFWWAFAAASLNHAIHNTVIVTLAYI